MAASIQDIQAQLAQEAKDKDERFEAAKTPEATQKLGASHNRIQGNVQKMLDQGGSLQDINGYLRDIEGINLEIDKEETPERKKTVATQGTIALSLARGSIKGTTSLAALPFLATDAIGYGFRRLFDERAEFDPTLSGKIIQGGNELAKLLDPNFSFGKGQELVESNFADRAAEKIGEFVTPGGILVKGMTNQGAKLLVQSPQSKNFMKRMFMDVAKNPVKAQAYEAGLGTTAAVAGELAATQVMQNANPSEIQHVGIIRFVAEISSMLGVTMGQRLVSKVTQLARGKLALTAKAQENAAELKIGEIFNEWMEADPNVLKSLSEAEDLLKAIPGLEMTTANVFQNPQMQAALLKVVETSPNGATRYLRMIETQRQRITQHIKDVEPVLNTKGPDLQKSLTNYMTKKFDELDARVTAAEQKAIDEAATLHPNRSPTEIGESGIEQMKLLEEEAEEAINVLYRSLDPDVMYNTNHIVASLRLAKFKPRRAEENVKRVAQGLEPLGLKGKGQEFGDISEELLQVATDNFAGKKASLDQLIEWRQMVGKEERLAGLAGDFETQGRLEFLRKGVDKQFERSSRRARTGKNATVFKEANAQWAAMKQRFDVAYSRLGIQKDLTGMYKFAPEDFGRKFIRSESQKAVVQSAKDFQRIFGDTPTAKALISDSVAYQLSRFKLEGGGFNLRGIQGWLKNHKASLQQHGIWDQFKDVGDAARAADTLGASAIVDRQVFNKSMLKAIIDAPNTGTFLKKHLQNGTLGTLGAEVRALKTASGKPNMPAIRGFTQEVWDAVISTADTKTVDTVEQIVRRPDAMLEILIQNKKALVEGIGKQHYASLQTIARALKRTEGKAPTFGARSTPAAVTPVVNQQMMGRAFSKIRASLQGFISPQFTAVQLVNQGLDIINTQAAQRVIQEALYDHKYAMKLADIAKTAAGKRAINMIGVAAVPATLDLIEEEDARTDY